MWKGMKFVKGRGRCAKATGWLEEVAELRPEATTVEGLLAALSHAERAHVRECRDCESAARDLIESRAMLKGWETEVPGSNPFFAKRVMAEIAAREAELERASRAWAVIPKLASRLAGIAMLVLLIAGTWVYRGPAREKANQPAIEPASQLFEDNTKIPADRDEVLVSLLERRE